MMSAACLRTAALSLTAIVALAAPAAAQTKHVNEEVGYRITLPEDYQKGSKSYNTLFDFLMSVDPYFLESFQCQKPLRSKSGATFYRRLTTYFFPERSAADIAREKAEREKAEKESGKKSVEIGGATKLYQNFQDYAKDRIRGFYFAEEKKLKVAGFPATVYEMHFEKLTGTPKRYMVCSYEVPGGEFAIMFTCTEEHFRKTRPEFHRAFESFRVLPSGLKAPEPERIEIKQPDPDLPKVTRETPVEELVKLRDAEFEKAIDGLKKGMRHLRGNRFLVLYAGETRNARMILRHAEALWDWLDANFGEFGQGYVQDAIIHIEGRGVYIGSAPRLEAYRRVHTFHTRELQKGTRSFRDSRLSTGLAHAWFKQRNDKLCDRMPIWLWIGLEEFIEDAELKGSKLRFEIDGGEARGLKSLVEAYDGYRRKPEGKPPVVPLSEIVGAPSYDLFANRRNLHPRRQAGSLIRYLLDGPGAKKPQTKILLRDYVANLKVAADELEAQLAEEKRLAKLREQSKDDMTDEERLRAEDEEYQNRRDQDAGKGARELLQKTFDQTFGDWTADDWEALDKSWLGFVKKIKADD